MYYLPDEILVSIFRFAVIDVSQLLALERVCRKFHRIANHPHLWYHLFKLTYPSWSSGVQYAYCNQPTIDWKQYILKLNKQKAYIASRIQFEPIHAFLDNDDHNDKKDSFINMEEPFVYDIDPITHTGVVAIAKDYGRGDHRVTFLNYPSYTLLHEMPISLETSASEGKWALQVVGMQTLQVKNEPMRFFALAVGREWDMDWDEQEEAEEEEDTDDGIISIWKGIFIYRLHDDGSTTFYGHANLGHVPQFLGRDVLFFGNEDWIKPWLRVVAPDRVPNEAFPNMLYLVACGPTLPRYNAYGHIVQFDVDCPQSPTDMPFEWDTTLDNQQWLPENMDCGRYSTALIATVRLGLEVSCMTYLNHLPGLSHLICTANFNNNMLSLYDWRLGVKVGEMRAEKGNEQPWGFETCFAVSSGVMYARDQQDMRMYGPRLVVVGDLDDQFVINVWDTSSLLDVTWQPFANHDNTADEGCVAESFDDEVDMASRYPWWPRASKDLRRVVRQYNEGLPYTLEKSCMLKTHVLNAPKRCIAYNLLQSYLYLLGEGGELTIVDIETGESIANVNTGVGVDINVLGDREVIVTKKRAVLRSWTPS